MPRPDERFAHRAEIGCTVDQHRGSRRVLDPPNIDARFQQHDQAAAFRRVEAAPKLLTHETPIGGERPNDYQRR